MKNYRVRANYNDTGIKEKVLKNEETDIKYANAFYNITIDAEDMKKAYDIAIQYLPIGSEIVNIELDHNCRCEPYPF